MFFQKNDTVYAIDKDLVGTIVNAFYHKSFQQKVFHIEFGKQHCSKKSDTWEICESRNMCKIVLNNKLTQILYKSFKSDHMYMYVQE